jgi:outer membrane murein-binding lipoprotein Lpp
MRARMKTLGEDKLAKWHELASPQKLAMHVDRLEVEVDAQRHDPPAPLRQTSSRSSPGT